MGCVPGKRPQHIHHVTRNLASAFPDIFDHCGVFQGWKLIDKEQIVQAAQDGYAGLRIDRQFRQELGDGVPADADAIGRVDEGNVADMRIKLRDPAVDLLDGHVADLAIPLFFSSLLIRWRQAGSFSEIVSQRIERQSRDWVTKCFWDSGRVLVVSLALAFFLRPNDFRSK